MLDKKQLPLAIVIAVVLLAASFFAGRWSVSSKAGQNGFSRNGGPGQSAMMAGNFRGKNGQVGRGGMVSGEIINKDEKSLTLKLANNGSKIIYFSASTTVSQMATATPSDLNVGQSVMASGSTNTDGSVSATMIQVRPVSGQPGQGSGQPAPTEPGSEQGNPPVESQK